MASNLSLEFLDLVFLWSLTTLDTAMLLPLTPNLSHPLSWHRPLLHVWTLNHHSLPTLATLSFSLNASYLMSNELTRAFDKSNMSWFFSLE
jgi:hypothetical protein